jgi:rubredoxin
MGTEDKYDEVFKKGDIVCPKCGFDQEGYEFGPDMIEMQGVDETCCPECEEDIKFELTYIFKVINND